MSAGRLRGAITRASTTTRVLIVVLYCLTIFGLSSIPDPNPPPIGITFADKIAHGLLYAGLMLVSYYAIVKLAPGWRPWRRVIVAFLFCAVFGASDEFHQLFVHGRTCELFDWVADMTGAAVIGVVRRTVNCEL